MGARRSRRTGEGLSRSRRECLQILLAAGAFAAFGPGVAGSGQAAQGMRTRLIPASGERLPIVGLGSARTFDAGPDEDELAPLREVLRRFFAAGGRLVDTSPMYGRAEAVIGTLAADLGITDRLFLATKVWTRGREQGIEQMRRSGSRLGVGRLDLIQVHNLVDLRTQLATLKAWREAGKVRYIGVTHYTSTAHDELVALIRREPLDFVQLNYNIAERNAEARLLPTAREHGVATLINEPFEVGSLFYRVRGHELPDWAAELDCASWAQFFLKYILSHPAVTCVLPATSDPAHLSDNVRAGYGRLPDDAQRRRMAVYLEGL